MVLFLNHKPLDRSLFCVRPRAIVLLPRPSLIKRHPGAAFCGGLKSTMADAAYSSKRFRKIK